MAIWTYFTDRYEQAKKKGEDVDFYRPPVVCLLIYTGKDRWNIPSLAQAFGFDEAFYPYTPEQTIISVGLRMEDGEKVLSSDTPIGKYCRLLTITDTQKETFKEILKEIHFWFLEIYEEDQVIYWNFIRFMVSIIYHRRAPEEREDMIEFVKSCIKPEEIEEVEKMKKTIADVIFEEGIEKGIEKGEIKKSQEAVLGILDARFGQVSADLAEKVKAASDLERLNRLIRLAATCENLEGFLSGM